MVTGDDMAGSSLLRQAALLSMIPLALGLGPAIGFFFGDALDRRWGTGPWLMGTGLVLGLAAGIRYAMALFTTATEQPKAEK